MNLVCIDMRSDPMKGDNLVSVDTGARLQRANSVVTASHLGRFNVEAEGM